jgi:hypothetical protein
MDARVRGTALVANREFLKKTYGADAWDRVLQTLPRQHAEALSVIPLAQDWLPAESMVASLVASAKLFSPDNLNWFYEEVGAHGAEYDLTFIHRFILKFTSPLWIMERGAKLWREYHNSGNWKIEHGATPHSLVGTLSDFAVVSAPMCRTVVGFVRRAGQLTGAKNIRVEHKRCRAEGAQVCVFEGEW